jgi:hypothetical protein
MRGARRDPPGSDAGQQSSPSPASAGTPLQPQRHPRQIPGTWGRPHIFSPLVRLPRRGRSWGWIPGTWGRPRIFTDAHHPEGDDRPAAVVRGRAHSPLTRACAGPAARPCKQRPIASPVYAARAQKNRSRANLRSGANRQFQFPRYTDFRGPVNAKIRSRSLQKTVTSALEGVGI